MGKEDEIAFWKGLSSGALAVTFREGNHTCRCWCPFDSQTFSPKFIRNHQDVFGSGVYMGWICPFVRLVKFVKHQPWESTLTTFSMASVEMASVDQGNVPCRLWTNETHQTVLARRNSSRSQKFFKHNRKNRSVILEVHIVTIFCYTNGGNQPKLEPANPLR